MLMILSVLNTASLTLTILLNILRELLKQILIKFHQPVRNENVVKLWTNNNCESPNHVLKQSTDWKSKPLTELVNRMQLIFERFRDLRGALISTGEYRLANNHETIRANDN